MSLPNPYAQYRQNSIETASSTRIIVMLYDGAIRFLTQALAAMQVKRYDQQSRFISNAQSIIAHLHDTLDTEIGHSFAESLNGIYTALLSSLTMANVQNQPGPVEEAVQILRELRETWAEVDRQCQSGKTRERELAAA
ncbi:MAG: flagellar export chaperone FliS [Janthinobacterium lividum]